VGAPGGIAGKELAVYGPEPAGGPASITRKSADSAADAASQVNKTLRHVDFFHPK